jgi:hypothetical protein
VGISLAKICCTVIFYKYSPFFLKSTNNQSYLFIEMIQRLTDKTGHSSGCYRSQDVSVNAILPFL